MSFEINSPLPSFLSGGNQESRGKLASTIQIYVAYKKEPVHDIYVFRFFSFDSYNFRTSALWRTLLFPVLRQIYDMHPSRFIDFHFAVHLV